MIALCMNALTSHIASGSVTAAISVGSWIVHDRNEDRLLEQRGHEAATVAASSVGGLQGQMAAASVAAQARARSGAVNCPPSENESGVKFSTPITAG